MNVFIFYRTDQWNSNKSKEMVYIGSNRKASIKKLMKLDSEPITEEQAEDLQRWDATTCNHVGYEWVVEQRELNSIC